MKSKEYIIQENITLAFDTKGRQYKLKINVDEGLLILDEYKEGEQIETICKILGGCTAYYGEFKKEMKPNLQEEQKLNDEPPSSLKLNKKKQKKKNK